MLITVNGTAATWTLFFMKQSILSIVLRKMWCWLGSGCYWRLLPTFPLGCATITGTQYPSRVAIAMLQDLYKEFTAKHGDNAKTAAENSLSKKAKPVFQQVCKKYEDPTGVDKTSKILGQVDAVKGQMQDNIANMLKNTEKAEDMAAKSEQLNEQASVFKKRSTDLKKQMQWKNLKMTLILGGVVLLIILVIVVPLVVRAKNLAT